ADHGAAPLSRAVRLGARARVAAREEDARAPRPPPGAPAAVPGAGLPRVATGPHPGAHRAGPLRPPHSRQGHRALSRDAAARGALARAGDRARPTPGRRVLLRRSAAPARAAVPRERAVGDPPRRA